MTDAPTGRWEGVQYCTNKLREWNSEKRVVVVRKSQKYVDVTCEKLQNSNQCLLAENWKEHLASQHRHVVRNRKRAYGLCEVVKKALK